jgi:regulator of protease activity HflC (stomatin/prohibitin superfamily)
MKKSLIKWIVLGIVLIVAVSLGLNCCSSVGPTEKGVMLTFGKPSDESLDPGLHFKSPIGQEIRTWDLSPIEYSKTFSVGQDGAISKDMQTIGVTFTLYWKYDPDRISEIARNFSNEQKIYQPLSTAAKAALKAEIGKYSVEEIIQNQAKITENVRSTFESDKDISNLPIIIQSLKIDNWDWDDSYEKMIKATMTRKQEVEQMKQEVALSEQAAQKQVKEAEAEKQRIELESEAALIKAQKEAEANIARAEGEAQAKKVKAEADRYEAEQIARAAEMKKAQWKHEENILELQAKLEHEKSWDGKLPPNYIPIAANGTIVSLPAGQNQ